MIFKNACDKSKPSVARYIQPREVLGDIWLQDALEIKVNLLVDTDVTTKQPEDHWGKTGAVPKLDSYFCI